MFLIRSLDALIVYDSYGVIVFSLSFRSPMRYNGDATTGLAFETHWPMNDWLMAEYVVSLTHLCHHDFNTQHIFLL